MVHIVNKKITGYKVITKDQAVEIAPVQTPVPELQRLHEDIPRPDVLHGSTYKIKTPQTEHAIYVTINDFILNEDTEHQERRPYEIFILSKNMENFQWIVVLTRVISAIFRKGGEVTFLVDELKAIFDPKGGYFKKGGVFIPSLVAELGYVLERHFKFIGLIKDEAPDVHMQQFIANKRKEFEEKNAGSTDAGSFPEQAVLCSSCNTKSAVLMDGCLTCLNCGTSKCG